MKVKHITLGSTLLAIGILLPFLTINQPQLGQVFLLMHIPALLAGFLLGGKWGGLVGFLMPLLRSVLVGMPPLYPTALIMSFELMTYAFVAGIVSSKLTYKSFHVILSLVLAMIAGRLVWGVMSVIFLSLENLPFTFEIFIAGAFITALPGIGIQLIFIPLLIHFMNRAKLIHTK
jgi:uncharacterized membrane protein